MDILSCKDGECCAESILSSETLPLISIEDLMLTMKPLKTTDLYPDLKDKFIAKPIIYSKNKNTTIPIKFKISDKFYQVDKTDKADKINKDEKINNDGKNPQDDTINKDGKNPQDSTINKDGENNDSRIFNIPKKITFDLKNKHEEEKVETYQFNVFQVNNITSKQ